MGVAKKMKAYEDELYEQWKVNVEMVLPNLLKRNLLIKPVDKVYLQAQTNNDEQGKEQEGGTTFFKNLLLLFMVFICQMVFFLKKIVGN